MSRQQQKLIVAMPKGRIFEEAVDLLRRAGVDLPPEFEESRKLIVSAPEAGLDFILAKPTGNLPPMWNTVWQISELWEKMSWWKKIGMYMNC